jgi:hypothetical protein
MQIFEGLEAKLLGGSQRGGVRRRSARDGGSFGPGVACRSAGFQLLPFSEGGSRPIVLAMTRDGQKW